ncbi:hypothetical protein Cni_G15775 [Canna indica]|uniref:Uncharacterized protein n=1 Tax=Canna indica TaxID=4628 RepID=A0AAQ3KEY4_9LILI|nr:hypothetical protein Cni_G15775 [Canna indica]
MNTMVFTNSWCFDIPIAFKPTFFYISMLDVDLRVADLLVNNSWNLDMLNNLFDSKVALKISRIGLALNPDEDNQLENANHALQDCEVARELWKLIDDRFSVAPTYV